jgi:hypothetical protein
MGNVKLKIVEACRDSGGPLHCRECGRSVSREEPEIHFIENGKCDCKECYDAAMDEEILTTCRACGRTYGNDEVYCCVSCGIETCTDCGGYCGCPEEEDDD